MATILQSLRYRGVVHFTSPRNFLIGMLTQKSTLVTFSCAFPASRLANSFALQLKTPFILPTLIFYHSFALPPPASQNSTSFIQVSPALRVPPFHSLSLLTLHLRRRAIMAPFTTNGSKSTYSQLSMPTSQHVAFADILFTGSDEAIAKLGSAIRDEGLRLPQDCQDSWENALAAAIQYQTRKSTFPAMQDINALIAEAETMADAPFAEFDNMIMDATSTEGSIIPPVSGNGFNIEEALSLLRSVSWAYFEGRVYEIGIVTQHANLATHEVDLLPSFPGSVPPATDTLWMTRRLETTTTGEVIESWDTLLPAAPQQQFLAPPPLPIVSTAAGQAGRVDQSSPILLPRSNSVEPVSEVESDPEGELDATMLPNTDQTGQPVKLALSDLLIYPDPSAGAGLTDEEILSGNNFHPDALVGDLILRLALSYKTTTLMDRINELYVTAKLPTRVYGSYTKRVTNAFHARMKKLDLRGANGVPLRYNTLRAQFDRYKNEQSIRKRPGNESEYKNKGVKKEDWQVSKKARRSRKRPAAGTTDDVEDGETTGPPSKRGRKSKKAKFSPEEVEMELEDGSDRAGTS
ncbi:uncharacterized protein MYCGRDRAFT_96417 [Zymoseptoria tritici IPO323]|uniref:Uncharacterized protein n=1 Tax=Zymoseptoria tritici (strain CBS 115943 / IPO323) TaxID=336722 RepID=F9XKV0_ZYMTI|nr:uncharacterized protein MYCGRDRAFT_96417 [Zymoseptoria tritici IPO323]EGP83966.1 hypothetical protein MYCGRDRAFT_96417 [Zymoseptoria tritici IPO323]